MLLTIKEDACVSSKLDEHKAKVSRVEDVWRGLCWMLAKNPHQGEAINGFFLMKSRDIFTIPVITALYKFDDNEVEVLDVRISETEED